MHASTFGVKGATLGVPKRRGLVDFVEFRNGSVLRHSRVSMAKSNTDLCGLRLGSATMETKLIGTSVGFGGFFGSSVKPRSVRVMTSGLYAVAYGFDFVWFISYCELFSDCICLACDVYIMYLVHVDGPCVVLLNDAILAFC